MISACGGWTGACAIADPSKLQTEDLMRISRTEIPLCHALTPKAKKYSFLIRVYLCLPVSQK
jgi:hypothetical protein